MLVRLDERHIEKMLQLQRECLVNADIFVPTSREGYLRAFRFNNFCYGCLVDGELTAFLNCSVPTAKSAGNLGRGRIAPEELDRVGHMNTLLVKKECRRSGIGRELMKASLEEFMRCGCVHIYATASPRNTASLKLLECMEFSRVDSIELQGKNRCLLYRRLPD